MWPVTSITPPHITRLFFFLRTFGHFRPQSHPEKIIRTSLPGWDRSNKTGKVWFYLSFSQVPFPPVAISQATRGQFISIDRVKINHYFSQCLKMDVDIKDTENFLFLFLVAFRVLIILQHRSPCPLQYPFKKQQTQHNGGRSLIRNRHLLTVQLNYKCTFFCSEKKETTHNWATLWSVIFGMLFWTFFFFQTSSFAVRISVYGPALNWKHLKNCKL